MAKQVDFPVLKGPYLGQKPPGKTPEIFAPGLISTYLSQSYIAFLDGARVCVFSTSTEKGHETYYTYEKDGWWIKPERAPFEELQGHPNYTTGPLGRRVYYHSGNPTHADDARLDDNIWTIEWTGSGWAEPAALPKPANSEYGEAYPSAAGDGTVYFFTWRREGTRGYDIWLSRCDRGNYREAERLPRPVNTDFIEYDPYIAPDESFLIFGSDRPGGFGKSDNYICFRREDGGWTSPMNLGRPYNSSSFDLCANGTPDGKYFFFTSGRKTEADKGEIGLESGEKPEEDADLYWADFTFIDDLKNILFTRKNAAKIIGDEYRDNGIRPAVDTLTGLYRDRKDSVYFPPFEFLCLAKDMLIAGEIEDADLFSSALEKALPEDLSIREGYARICAMNGFVSKGMKIFEELDRDDPDFDLNEALSSLGYLFTLYPERTRDALSVLRFTVEKFPDDPWAYYGLARVYRRLGDLDKAIENCRKSLELSPEVGDISQLLERLLEERGSKKERPDCFPALTGPYLGQEPPGKKPEVFAPELFSDFKYTFCSVFSPDGKEYYFAAARTGEYKAGIFWMRRMNDEWTKPEPAPFNSPEINHDMRFSADGSTIFFQSWRPLPGSHTPDKLGCLWSTSRINNGWSEPQPVKCGDGILRAGYPDISRNGILYFSMRDKNTGNVDIHRARLINGAYTPPENLGQPINTEYIEGDLCVSPDERFIIVSCWERPDNTGGGESDLYIGFRQSDGTWTRLINMGEAVNTKYIENCPTISPDEKYFFFQRFDGVDVSETFWVDAEIIDRLVPEKH